MKKVLSFLFLALPLIIVGQKPTLVVPVSHTQEITAVAFSNDGQLLVTGSEDKSIKIWNLQGQLVQGYASRTDRDRQFASFKRVAFSPDDSYVIAYSTYGYIDMWDLYGKKFPLFEGYSYTAVAISPSCPDCPSGESPYVLAAGSGTVALLNLQSDTLISFEVPGIRSVTFSPLCSNCPYGNGNTFLTTTEEGNATLYGLKGDTLQHFEFPRLQEAGFTPDGRFLYFKGNEGQLTLKTLEGETAFNLDLSGRAAVRFAPPCFDCPAGDGPAILTGSTDGNIRLFNMKGEELNTFQVPEWTSLSFAPRCHSCSYGKDPYLLTADKDGNIRIWNLSGKEESVFRPPAQEEDDPINTTFSPDGKHFLTRGSYYDNDTIRIWDTQGTLMQEISHEPAPSIKGGFQPDGQVYLTTTKWVEDFPVIRYWDMGSGQQYLPPAYPEGESFYAFSPDGQYTLSIKDTTLFLRGPKGELLQPMPIGGWDVPHFSADGKTIYNVETQYREEANDEEGTYQARARIWDFSGKEQNLYFSNTYHYGGLFKILSPGKNLLLLCDGEDPRGSQFQLLSREEGDITPENDEIYYGEESDCAAFSTNERYLLQGHVDGVIRWFDLKTDSVREIRAHTANVTSTAISKDGRLALTGSADGTAILWQMETREKVATIIPLNDKDWVCISPNGLFDASPGAMALMYFSLGRELIELEQLKERYYEPGLLDKLLGFSDDPIRSVEGFDSIALYPLVSLQLDSQAHQLQIELSPRNGGLGKVSVFINGKEVIEDANPPQGYKRKRKTSLPSVNLMDYRRYFLQDSLNTITVRAYNEAGWLKSPARTVAYRPRFARSKGPEDKDAPSLSLSFQPIRNPALYAIIVGTANYAGEKLDLKFPGKDAAAMAQAIQQAGSQLFEDRVHVRLFTTDTAEVSMRPTRANIKAAFDDFKRQANAEDILLVYLSGHGVTYGDAERAQFYYLTQDISSEDLSDEGIRKKRTISTAELTQWINDIPAQKQVMILDACNSGKVVEILDSGTKNLNSTQIRAFDRMKDRTGMYILAGSAADKVSYEASQYGQGLLTFSILKGMSGDKLREGKYVDIVSLFEYAVDEVPKLAKSIGGIQAPTLLTPHSGSIDIGIVNDDVDIPLAVVKPVFIRSYFMDETLLSDNLGLTRQLEEAFREISAKGPAADLIYVDISHFPKAYTIRGLYRITEGRAEGKGQLFYGEKAVDGGKFTFSGAADKPKEIKDYILAQVKKIVKQDNNKPK